MHNFRQNDNSNNNNNNNNDNDDNNDNKIKRCGSKETVKKLSKCVCPKFRPNGELHNIIAPDYYV